MQEYDDSRETLRMAQHWDNRLAKYEAAGFCRVCSTQAAWGHSIGFARVRPACSSCRGLTVPGNSGRRAQEWANGERLRTAL